MPPKSKFQQQREAAAEQPAPVERFNEEFHEAAADGSLGEVIDTMIELDKTRAEETPATLPNELTYTNEESQALPDDPHIDPTFEPVAAPPPAKGKKGKITVGDGKVQLPPSATTNVPPPEPPKGKAKGKGKAKETPDQPKVTVERVSTNLPATLTNVATAIANNQNFTVTALGLRVEGAPSLEEWASYGQASGVMHNGLDWADYDWARYGEEHFGESYAQWLDSTGLAGQTLYNRMSALRKYTIDERVYGVSISAHVEVAGLDRVIRAGLLKEMQDGKIKTISELRERIKAIKKGLDDKDKEDKGKDSTEGDGEGDEGEDEAADSEWSQVGEFLYEHVGDGMLEPILEKGKLPAELAKLLKTKAMKGTIKIAIFIPE